MADTLTKEKRSWNMARIKSGDTKPEIMVRQVLHAMGYRFRLHNSKLPGKPDIVVPKYKTAIFVHGCFWHRHKGCKYSYTPKSNIEFWKKKFKDNIRRDHIVEKQISEMGWKQLVIWECETKDKANIEKILKAFFCDRNSAISI